MPAEHGGWGLTLEPGVLGVLLAPSLAGALLGLAALLAFLLRTPLRLVLIGRRRTGRPPSTSTSLARQRLATRIAGVELAGLVVAAVVAALLAADPLWWGPMLMAVPLLAVAVWFDVHSLSRHPIAEIAGSVAVAGVAAMGALAGGAAWPLAFGAWIVLVARVLTSIPHVRAQVSRIHGREAPALPTLVGDGAALVAASVAVVIEPALALGAVSIVGLIAVQQVTLRRPPRPARVLGVRQMLLGFTVVGTTAVGAWLL